MNGSLQVRMDPPGDPIANMKADCALVQAVREDSALAILRIYRWNQPALSIGRRQSVEDLPSVFREAQSVLVRRPTGGGAVLHRLDELTYAFAISRGVLPAHISIREIVGVLHRSLRRELIARKDFSVGDLTVVEQDAPGPATFCFSAPVRGDLMFQGRKVAGAALRVWRDAILVQGSIQGLTVGQDQLSEAVRKSFMVRKERFELSRVSPRPSEDRAYASSATSALSCQDIRKFPAPSNHINE